ncbi:MAG: hypothetical protein IJ494_10180 [Bacteroides sp.]|nr:hypothetical protein [Bacteroides sp.]
MNAKWSISNYIYVFCLGLFCYQPTLSAQEPELLAMTELPAYTENLESKDTVHLSQPRSTRYDQRIHRYRKRWEALIPTHSKIQFAGNMGLLSLGMGWDYGKHNQWETDLLLGFLPKYQSDKAKATFTVKQNYIPWSLRIKESDFSIEPLTCGVYLNTVFGDEFWVKEPDRYPKGYYGFSSKVRFHIFMGQRLTYDFDRSKQLFAKAITLFYEISTCDLFAVSAFTNSYLKPKDYLSLSFGVKLQLL